MNVLIRIIRIYTEFVYLRLWVLLRFPPIRARLDAPPLRFILLRLVPLRWFLDRAIFYLCIIYTLNRIKNKKVVKNEKINKLLTLKFNNLHMNIPLRYLPSKLSKRDKQRQTSMLKKSKKLYKKNQYFSRASLPSFQSKPSSHIENAKKTYKVNTVRPTKELAKKTGCTLNALKQIVKKGEGAYYSSGSRPNQTAQSWGIARLASSITGGKAAAVDYDIINKGCDHSKKAFRLAKQSKKKYNHGQSKTKKVRVH